MKADDNRDKRMSPARILGIIIIVLGLLVAVWHTFNIRAYF